MISELVEPLFANTYFADLVKNLENVYDALETKNVHEDHQKILDEIYEIVEKRKTEISKSSRTCAMWVKYLEMTQIARDLVRAERTGDWLLHLNTVQKCLPIFGASGHFNHLKTTYLYLMKSHQLPTSCPRVYENFVQGGFVCRRSAKFWGGLGLDLCIEQVLMRSLKTRGGLTRGSGFNEEMRTIWTLSAPVSSEYNLAMQELSGASYITSDQHREGTKARVQRDHQDFSKLQQFVAQFKPFAGESSETSELRNIVTGLHANENVNVDRYWSVGSEIVKNMAGKSVFDFSFSRKDKVTTMSFMKAVKIDDDRSIDPAVLFQRMIIITNTGEISLEEMVVHELCSFPPALFSSNSMPLEADKAPLAHALDDYCTSKLPGQKSTTPPKTDHYVMDGGSLIHRLNWEKGKTYGQIAEAYANMACSRYFRPTVVFDVYEEKPSTKDCTHMRRNPGQHQHPEVGITSTTTFLSNKKEDVISNSKNKDQLIKLVQGRLLAKNCQVQQVSGDADVAIAKAAVEEAETKSTTLIGEDTDLLVLLLYHSEHNDELYFRSDKMTKKTTSFYDIQLMREALGPKLPEMLLFSHAFTGCDIASRIAGIGKKGALQRLMKSDGLQ